MRHRLALLLLGAALVGCGARTGGVSDELDASIPDAAPRDTAPPDAPPPDAGPDARAPGGCEVTRRLEVAQFVGRADYPSLARLDDRAMLAVTRTVDDGPSELLVLPITPLGEALAELRVVGLGSGGTLVAHTLDPAERGFTLSFTNASGVLAGARFDVDARAIATAPLGVPTESMRPLLVLSPALVANGWNTVGTSTASGMVTDLASRTTAMTTFAGRSPVGARAGAPDLFLAATTDGSTAFVETFDARGVRRGVRTVTPTVPPSFPLGLSGARVVDGAPDALVLFGGVIRALEQSYLGMYLGPLRETWMPVGDRYSDEVAAAYDVGSEWLGVALGAYHDEGVDRGPTPHVFFHGLGRRGGVAELIVAGPLSISPDPSSTQVRTAIATIGGSAATFLVVWTWNEGDTGHVDGAVLRCR